MRVKIQEENKLNTNNSISYLNHRKIKQTKLNKITNLKETKMSWHLLLSYNLKTCHQEDRINQLLFKISQSRSKLIDLIRLERKKTELKILWKMEHYLAIEVVILINQNLTSQLLVLCLKSNNSNSNINLNKIFKTESHPGKWWTISITMLTINIKILTFSQLNFIKIKY